MAKVGRHSKFKPSYIKKVDDYLKLCVDSSVGVPKQKNTNKGYTVYEREVKVNLPSIDGFALYLGVSRKSIYNWRDNYDDFANALEKIEIEQKLRLMNSGLSGSYNPTISKLILSSNHGMKERVDNTTNDKPINPSYTDEQIYRIAERLSRRRRQHGNAPGKK